MGLSIGPRECRARNLWKNIFKGPYPQMAADDRRIYEPFYLILSLNLSALICVICGSKNLLKPSSADVADVTEKKNLEFKGIQPCNLPNLWKINSLNLFIMSQNGRINDFKCSPPVARYNPKRPGLSHCPCFTAPSRSLLPSMNCRLNLNLSIFQPPCPFTRW